MDSTKIEPSQVKLTQQLKIALTKLLYKHLYTSLPALVILASVIAWAVERYANILYLKIWYITFITIIVLRGALACWYSYTKNRLELYRLHHMLFIIVSSLIAILWGISDSVLMPHILSSQFLVIIIMAGVTAGGSASLMPSYLASSLYINFSLVPLIVWLILQGNQSIYPELSIVITLYWIFLLAVGYHGYKLFVSNVELILEKNRILENLSLTNNKLSQAIDLQKIAEEKLSYIAYHDILTQLDNRKMLEIKFQQVLNFAKRNKHKLAVLYIDIDYFKKINDSLGHEAGDIFLKLVAQRLENLKRKTDILARLGGDEFVLVLTEIIHESEIRNIIHMLQKMISKDFIIQGNTIQVSLSIGASVYPKDGEDLKALLSHADIALYRVKKSGRNGFQFYDSAPEIISNNEV